MKRRKLTLYSWLKLYHGWPLILFVLFLPLAGFSQDRVTVNGVVQSADDGLPLPGVSINANNQTVGTSATNGGFSVEVPVGTGLSFTFLGFETRTIQITKPENNLTISLETSSTNLEDVVVVGYGTQKKVN